MGSFLTVNYTAAFFTSLNPVMAFGELGTETNTGLFKVGDGVTNWIALPYGFPPVSSAVNTVQATVDFGSTSGQETDLAIATVLAPWVAVNSVIVCSPYAVDTVNHGPEDAAVEGIVAYATNIVPGVSFDVVAAAPSNTFGTYIINVQESKL